MAYPFRQICLVYGLSLITSYQINLVIRTSMIQNFREIKFSDKLKLEGQGTNFSKRAKQISQ